MYKEFSVTDSAQGCTIIYRKKKRDSLVAKNVYRKTININFWKVFLWYKKFSKPHLNSLVLYVCMLILFTARLNLIQAKKLRSKLFMLAYIPIFWIKFHTPYHHAMARHQFADGGKVYGHPTRGDTLTFYLKNPATYEVCRKASDLA